MEREASEDKLVVAKQSTAQIRIALTVLSCIPELDCFTALES